MKKVFVALMCMASLVIMTACGGNAKKSGDVDEPGKEKPSSSQQQDKPGAKSFEWPENAAAFQWTGSGKIVGTNTITYSRGEVEIYYDTATLEEVGAYIEMLKGRGFTYYGEGDEPALEFDEDGAFVWACNYNAIRICLLKEPDTIYAVDGKYQLEITVMPNPHKYL